MAVLLLLLRCCRKRHQTQNMQLLSWGLMSQKTGSLLEANEASLALSENSWRSIARPLKAARWA